MDVFKFMTKNGNRIWYTDATDVPEDPRPKHAPPVKTSKGGLDDRVSKFTDPKWEAYCKEQAKKRGLWTPGDGW